MEHNTEKWETHPVSDTNVIYVIINGEAEEICRTPGITPTDKANARRIVWAVNACEGIETEILETLPLNFKQHANEFDRMKSQNARLLEALKDAEDYWRRGNPTLINQCEAAIAEAETNKPA